MAQRASFQIWFVRYDGNSPCRTFLGFWSRFGLIPRAEDFCVPRDSRLFRLLLQEDSSWQRQKGKRPAVDMKQRPSRGGGGLASDMQLAYIRVSVVVKTNSSVKSNHRKKDLSGETLSPPSSK